MATINGRNKSNNNNNNKKHNNNSKSKNNEIFFLTSIVCAIWSVLTLTTGTTIVVQGAAVYSNDDFLSNPNFEPICTEQQERFIESEGKESSLILEFNSANSEAASCKRILSAPSAYGFIVRLILPKIRQQQRHQSSVVGTVHQRIKSAANNDNHNDDHIKANEKRKIAAATALNEMTSLIEKLNSTVALKVALGGRTCPLSIFSSLDPHIPQWRVDPCQLEDTAPEMEDPVRLFHGRVRIVWEHGHNKLDSKLMVTVLGKGEQCRSETKHQCLKIGDEPILCISKNLTCDGIRHCPYSNEYDSDEDYGMCWKRHRFGEPLPTMESDIFENFALEVFRNLFAFDVPAISGADSKKTSANGSTTGNGSNATTVVRTDVGVTNAHSGHALTNVGNDTITLANGTEIAGGSNRRNSTRMGIHSDLSKYGPWGYLMLGMFLCGGALLICGLWASASQHATNNERESALQHANAGLSSSHDHPSAGAPPNYEELDPPPSYSVLFPNQKSASTATLNMMAANAILPAATAAATTAAAAAAATDNDSAQQSVSGDAMVTSTTTITRVQLELPVSGTPSGSDAAAAAATN